MSQKSKVRQPRIGGCMAYGFCGIFAAAGLAAFFFLALLPIFSILQARSWQRTTCVIESSHVVSSRGSDSTIYRVDIRYTYIAERGETFHGDRYDFSGGSSSGYKAKARIVAAHWPGNEVDCYFDPKRPERSVINRSPGGYLWWGLFPLPFLAIGFGGLFFLVKARDTVGQTRRKSTKRRRRRSGTEPVAATRLATPMASVGPLELESEASPRARAIGVAIAALFWNGIVSLFVFGTILPSFREGSPEWFAAVFMVPFVLIGLVLIVGTVYQFLASFNPRPNLTLAEGHLTPGAETSLSWRVSGRADRIQKLSFEIEGREEARYRRGTNTSTDRHVFFSQLLTTRVRPFEAIDRGHTTLQIPPRTMPTFKAPNNKIEWRIKVFGEVPFWPDVKEVFSIVIRPGEDS